MSGTGTGGSGRCQLSSVTDATEDEEAADESYTEDRVELPNPGAGGANGRGDLLGRVKRWIDSLVPARSSSE